MCETIGNKIYNGFCLRCFIHLFPNEKISRRYKIKEQYMVDFILKEFPEESIIVDKIVNGGCSRRRPDVYIDKLTHVVIVECDENRHNQQAYSCDNKRLMELFQDFGSRPLVIIRFNPDSYIDSDKTRHPSCFSNHKGFDVPIVFNQEELDMRFRKLAEVIDTVLGNIPEREITTHSLFY